MGHPSTVNLSGVEMLAGALAQSRFWPPRSAELIKCDHKWRKLADVDTVKLSSKRRVDRGEVAGVCVKTTRRVANEAAEPHHWKLILLWDPEADPPNTVYQWTANAQSIALGAQFALSDPIDPSILAPMSGMLPIRELDPSQPMDEAAALRLLLAMTIRQLDVANIERRGAIELLMRGQASMGGAQTEIMIRQGEQLMALTADLAAVKTALATALAERDMALAGSDPVALEKARSDAESRKAMGDVAAIVGVPLGLAAVEYFAPGAARRLGLTADNAIKMMVAGLEEGEPLSTAQIAMLRALVGAPAGANGAAGKDTSQ